MTYEEQMQHEAIFNKRAEDVLTIEGSRRAAEAEKTARLRALRLAKEAAEREHGPGGRPRKGAS